jgi:hypothetical protein
MTKKLILAFAVAGLSLASAKTYSLRTSQPFTLEGTLLRPNHYKIKLDGAKAIFTSPDTNTPIEARVKVANSQKKFDQTAILSKEVQGKNEIEQIQLGGTTMELEFN